MSEPEGLSPLEQVYWEKYMALFARVQAQKPEKGVWAMIHRSRTLVRLMAMAEATAFEEVYLAAEMRTEARLRLLPSCPVTNPGGD